MTVCFPQIPLSRYGDAQSGAEAASRCGAEGGPRSLRGPTERAPHRQGGWEPGLARHAGEGHKLSPLHQPSHQKGALHTRGGWMKVCVWLSLNFLHCCGFAVVRNVPSVCVWTPANDTNELSCLEQGMFSARQKKALRLTQILTCGPVSVVCLSLSVPLFFRLCRTGSLWLRCWTGFSSGPSSQCQYWELS